MIVRMLGDMAMISPLFKHNFLGSTFAEKKNIQPSNPNRRKSLEEIVNESRKVGFFPKYKQPFKGPTKKSLPISPPDCKNRITPKDLIFIHDGVHVFNPNSINRSIKDQPFPFFSPEHTQLPKTLKARYRKTPRNRKNTIMYGINILMMVAKVKQKWHKL